MKFILLIAVMTNGTPIIQKVDTLENCVEKVRLMKVANEFKSISCRTLKR